MAPNKEICPLCKRPLENNKSRHHLVPRSKKKYYKNNGKFVRHNIIVLHLVCHHAIHSLFSEKDLATKYNTIEKLLQEQGIKDFVNFVQSKDPSFDCPIRKSKKD